MQVIKVIKGNKKRVYRPRQYPLGFNFEQTKKKIFFLVFFWEKYLVIKGNDDDRMRVIKIEKPLGIACVIFKSPNTDQLL